MYQIQCTPPHPFIFFLTFTHCPPSIIHPLVQYSPTHQQAIYTMAKYNKMWKALALRMCSTTARSEKEGWQLVGEKGPTVFQGFVSIVGLAGAWWVAYDSYIKTPYYLDKMLRDVVTTKYDPEMPEGMTYIKRAQDDDLKEKLYKNFYGSRARGFFMLMGESGSGKTTMMQNLLLKEYEDGVIFVKINAVNLVNVPIQDITGVFEETVLRKFADCKNHPRRKLDFDDFIGHANGVWLKSQKRWQTWLSNMWYKKKEHPLIIYITLDTKDTKLEHETMQAIAVAVGGMASKLSSQANKCRTILEFSKTGISDHVQQVRGDYDDFEVNAMTETEFQEIGKQVLNVEDPENLVEPYLKYYHDWLGGHTKGLVQLDTGKEPAGPKSMHRFVAFLYNMIFNHTSHRSCVCHP